MYAYGYTWMHRYISYLTVYKTHGCIRRTPISGRADLEKKQSSNIKCDKINTMNIIKDRTFNLHNSLLNYDNRYMKVTLKSKLIGVAR